jgi:hypothetical protein
MPVYQQDLAHYNVLIGQANKPIMNIYVVSFQLSSHGEVGPGTPNAFPGVDFYVRRTDYKVVGKNFSSLW